MAKTLRFYHVVLGGFLLPMALVFFVTGALYAVDITGGKKSIDWAYQEKGGYTLATDDLTRSVASQFASKGISLKLSSIPKIRTQNNGDRNISWNIDSSRVKAMIRKSQPDTVIVRVKQVTFFKSFLDLHKVKLGFAFATYAFIASIALIILSITGFLMLIKDKRHRLVGLLSALAGTLVFVILIAF
ncbi:MAG: hypothetical protein BMS9Abin25_0468 [Gammaproteobacteria bacterium]|nr:MAG: hypothetical protein BMS9Abin25_0468 [Gammaproteobacteria bacterium]